MLFKVTYQGMLFFFHNISSDIFIVHFEDGPVIVHS